MHHTLTQVFFSLSLSVCLPVCLSVYVSTAIIILLTIVIIYVHIYLCLYLSIYVYIILNVYTIFIYMLPICIGDQVEEEEEMTQWMGLLMEELERCPWAGDWFAREALLLWLLQF